MKIDFFSFFNNPKIYDFSLRYNFWFLQFNTAKKSNLCCEIIKRIMNKFMISCYNHKKTTKALIESLGIEIYACFRCGKNS